MVTVRVATPDIETIDAIHRALDARTPLALLHAKLPPGEQARQRALVEAARYEPDDALVLFTSGSSGAARGVVLSRASIEAAARASWDHLGRRDGDRWACVLPMAHAGGASIVVRCRAAGIPVDLPPHSALRPDTTLLSIVPAQLAALEPSAALRAVLVGGAAASRPHIDAAVARGIPVLPTYGLTETFGQVATARTPGGPLVPLPGVEITGGSRDAPAPLTVRGPMVATRYLDGAPIAPVLVTADLGFVEDGVVHIVGRADDVIISGGENVHPAQVEAVLAATAGVRDVVTFPVADDRWGQIVAAALAVDEQFARDAALAHWHGALAPHARPRRLVLVSELPRLPSGKLDRRAIMMMDSQPIDYARLDG